MRSTDSPLTPTPPHPTPRPAAYGGEELLPPFVFVWSLQPRVPGTSSEAEHIEIDRLDGVVFTET